MQPECTPITRRTGTANPTSHVCLRCGVEMPDTITPATEAAYNTLASGGCGIASHGCIPLWYGPDGRSSIIIPETLPEVSK